MSTRAQAFAWDWFATLTFRRYASEQRAAKAWLWWVREVSRRALGRSAARHRDVPWIRVIEPHRDRGVHLHAVVGGVGHLDRVDCLSLWRRRHGAISQVAAFASDRPYLEYLLKAVDRGADFDVSRSIP